MNRTHNFILAGCDTDSILFTKADQSEFSEEEQKFLLQDLNSNFPKGIVWEHDGLFTKVIYAKAKNYILFDGQKLKIKGAALKATTKEPALKEFIKAVIDSMINDRDDFKELYEKYVREIMDVKDIKRWASRKTISAAVLTSTRLNETKVLDAMAGTEFSPGDRRYFFYLPADPETGDDDLELVENFNGAYNKDRLLKKLHDTSKIFSTILPVKELFINYSLKRSKPLLETLLMV